MFLSALLAKLVVRAAFAATRIYYEMGRQGPPLPDGPVLVVANHPNSLMDALVLLTLAGRPVRPLARAPLFTRPILGHVLRELGGLPVYRPQDDPRRLGENEATFEAAVSSLLQGEAVLIFPEGLSHSDPDLAPLRTGAARIALRFAERAGGNLGLRIVPVGLVYRRKTTFRGEAAARFGAGFEIAPGSKTTEVASAVRSLTDVIARSLEEVMVRFDTARDAPILEAAEALYAAERGFETAGDLQDLAARLPRLQRFAEGMTWLRAHDPERFARMADAVRIHRRRLARLGLRSGELPAERSKGAMLRFLGAETLVALVGLPLVVLGISAWYVPYMLPRAVQRLHRPAFEAQATVKLLAALVAFPLFYVLWLGLAARAWGGLGFGLAAVLLPLSGFATLHWRVHWRNLRQEIRFWIRAGAHHDLVPALRLRRAVLADEIDRIAADWDQERGRRTREDASHEPRRGSSSQVPEPHP